MPKPDVLDEAGSNVPANTAGESLTAKVESFLSFSVRSAACRMLCRQSIDGKHSFLVAAQTPNTTDDDRLGKPNVLRMDPYTMVALQDALVDDDVNIPKQ